MASGSDLSAAPGASSAPSSRAPRAGLTVLALLFVVVGVLVAGVRNVSGGEIGVSVNNLSGDVRLEDKVGLHFTIPYVISFYTIDKTEKTLAMLGDPPAGQDGTKPPADFLNVKSAEGDNVKVDVKVTYRIEPEKAVEVLRTTGSEALAANGILRNWVRPTVRAAVADRFNELTREEMNEGDKRREQAQAALDDINKKLRERFGILITSIAVENPSSYPEYEQIVRARKDTDQEVKAIVEQQGAEREAQKKRVNEEQAKYDVAISAAEAQAERDIAEATAKATKTVQEAEAEYVRVTAEAVGKLKKDEAEANGRRKQAEADYEGTRQLVMALAGTAGSQLVAAEFAKRLKDMQITATPFVYNGVVQPYLMEQGTGGKAVPLPGAGAAAPILNNPQPTVR